MKHFSQVLLRRAFREIWFSASAVSDLSKALMGLWGKAVYAQRESGEMCVFCAQMLCHALHDCYSNLCWEGAMRRGTVLFFCRPESFEYSVSSLTASTPWSWPHEYAEECAFEPCFLQVSCEDHVTIW